jgi:hypothetical protein
VEAELSVSYEYSEKRICLVVGDAAVQRQLVRKETTVSELGVSYGCVRRFMTRHRPHHKASNDDSTETIGSIQGKAGQFPEIC